MAPIDIATIKAEFLPHLEGFCHQHLPGGKRRGREWVCGSPAGEPGGSMSVCLRGAKAGVWRDFSSGEGGDAISLVAEVLFRGDLKEALAWIKAETGLSDLDPNSLRLRRREAQEKRRKAREQAEAEARKLRGQARHMWLHEAQADLNGTLTADYLAGRGLPLVGENGVKLVGGAIRHIDACYCSEARRALPAMLTQIVNGDGRIISVHRTYLERRPDGSVSKARLEQPKKTLGLYKGGYISISRGHGNRPMHRARPGDLVLATEGIENALTLRRLDAANEQLDPIIAAAVAVSNFANLPVPAGARLVIVGDAPLKKDGRPNEAVSDLVDAAVRTHKKRGVIASRWWPDAGDINDMLMKEGA